MKCWNPDCSNELSPQAAACPLCKTERPMQAGSSSSIGPRVTVTIAGREFSCPQCEAAECRQPGTLSASTLGTGPWWCHTHFPPFRYRQLARSKRPTGPAAPDFDAIAERLAITQEPAP